MRLHKYLDMEIERYHNDFKNEPNLYFIRTDILNRLREESRINSHPSLFEDTRFCHYKSVALIPVDDPFINQCVLRFEDLDEYKFSDLPEAINWSLKIKVKKSTCDSDYINVRPSVLRVFDNNYDILKNYFEN
ncbi:hypothetical protein ACG93T_05500 [Acinetobacter beijerinckii]|uniref:hypothetical protein n=1 Tax=Acinetobacter beijerinckii TaxID=262668 RepID=UPI003AF8B3A5